jgi:hypothetical protein
VVRGYGYDLAACQERVLLASLGRSRVVVVRRWLRLWMLILWLLVLWMLVLWVRILGVLVLKVWIAYVLVLWVLILWILQAPIKARLCGVVVTVWYSCRPSTRGRRVCGSRCVHGSWRIGGARRVRGRGRVHG